MQICIFPWRSRFFCSHPGVANPVYLLKTQNSSRIASSSSLVYPGRENFPKSWLLFQLTFCFANLFWVCRNCLLHIQQMQMHQSLHVWLVWSAGQLSRNKINFQQIICHVQGRPLIVIKVIKWINVSLYLFLLPTGKNSSYMSSREEHELQKELINKQQIITNQCTLGLGLHHDFQATWYSWSCEMTLKWLWGNLDVHTELVAKIKHIYWIKREKYIILF